jgi:hypothetical protein
MKIIKLGMKDKSEIKVEDINAFIDLVEICGYETIVASDKYTFEVVDADKLITCNNCIIKEIIE